MMFWREKGFLSLVRKVTRQVTAKDKKKRVEARIKRMDKLLAQRILNFHARFRRLEKLPPFYIELLNLSVSIDEIKKALGQIWAILPVLASIRDDCLFKLRKEEPKKVWREYLGRVRSVLKRSSKSFELLRKTEKEIRKLPPVRFDMPTIVIAGYPNVGKSTLLSSLTGSTPEISPIPFTTKHIMLGYFSSGPFMIQVVDTPGMLDRPLPKKNEIEMRAILALKHLANVIIFLVDPTESCGFDLEAQKKLYDQVKEMFGKTRLLLVFNKKDLANQKQIEKAIRAFGEPDLIISALDPVDAEKVKLLCLKKLGIKTS